MLVALIGAGTGIAGWLAAYGLVRWLSGPSVPWTLRHFLVPGALVALASSLLGALFALADVGLREGAISLVAAISLWVVWMSSSAWRLWRLRRTAIRAAALEGPERDALLARLGERVTSGKLGADADDRATVALAIVSELTDHGLYVGALGIAESMPTAGLSPTMMRARALWAASLLLSIGNPERARTTLAAAPTGGVDAGVEEAFERVSALLDAIGPAPEPARARADSALERPGLSRSERVGWLIVRAAALAHTGAVDDARTILAEVHQSDREAIARIVGLGGPIGELASGVLSAGRG